MKLNLYRLLSFIVETFRLSFTTPIGVILMPFKFIIHAFKSVLSRIFFDTRQLKNLSVTQIPNWIIFD